MPRARRYGGGLVGGASPRVPAESRDPQSWPAKPLPKPGELTAALGGGTSPSIVDRQAISLPPFSYPPEGAYTVDETDDVVLAPGASATLMTITVPLAQRLRIYGIGFDAFDPVALSFLTWSLLRNGIPDRAYTNQAAVIGSVRIPSPLVFFAPNQTVITLVLTLNALSPSSYTYVARVQAYFYSDTTG